MAFGGMGFEDGKCCSVICKSQIHPACLTFKHGGSGYPASSKCGIPVPLAPLAADPMVLNCLFFALLRLLRPVLPQATSFPAGELYVKVRDRLPACYTLWPFLPVS